VATIENDARAHPRYEVEASADVIAGDRSSSHQIQNLSLGGICIQTSVVTEVGAPVDVVLRFREGEELALRGQVVWVNREPPQDVGIRWLDIDDPRRARLERYLEAALAAGR
jgi:Tfp pilus assembly protein PilZ